MTIAAEWLPSSECAALMGVSPQRVGQLVKRGKLVAKRDLVGSNSSGLVIKVASLPQAAREKLAERLYSLHATPAVNGKRAIDDPALRPELRERAVARMAAVDDYRRFLRRRLAEGAKFAAAEREWLADYTDRTEFAGSLKSVHRWVKAYERHGIDGLLDHNDGSARRGKYGVQSEALNFFRERYLDPQRPTVTISMAIAETRMEAERQGWSVPQRDDSFYRYARKCISKVERLARRDAADKVATFTPSVLRESDLPYRTLQSDHHLVDVFVSCEGQVCGESGCKAGHRPWWTPMFDVGSRKIVSYQISLDVPNYRRILSAFQLAVEKEGLPQRFYVDNGKDFKKATGKNAPYRLSKEETITLENRFGALGVEVVWATPYNAQAKAIERFFGTFATRVWPSFESHVGRLGKRTEHAHHLFKNPALLPTFSAFCERLADEVALYNNRPHRGYGMNGRTPSEVLVSQHRVPRRDPARLAFALVFHRCETRTLRPNGIYLDNVVYRLVDPSGAIHVAQQGQKVKVLIDPADVSRALICDLHDQYLCEASVAKLATNDTRDAVTQEVMEAVASHRKAILRRAKSGDVRAQFLARNFRSVAAQLLRREAERRRVQEEQLVAAVGSDQAVTVVLPRFSKLARDVEFGRSLIVASEPPALTPEQLRLAEAASDDSDAFLDRADRLNAAGAFDEEPIPHAEMERLRGIREQNLKRARHECLDVTCEEPAWQDGYCRIHYTEPDFD